MRVCWTRRGCALFIMMTVVSGLYTGPRLRPKTRLGHHSRVVADQANPGITPGVNIASACEVFSEVPAGG